MYQKDEDNNEMFVLDLFASSPSSEQEVVAQESYERILQVVETLPENQRKVFELCCLNEMKPAEAADILGCKIQDVYNWKKRAVDKVKSFIEIEIWEMSDRKISDEEREW